MTIGHSWEGHLPYCTAIWEQTWSNSSFYFSHQAFLLLWILDPLLEMHYGWTNLKKCSISEFCKLHHDFLIKASEGEFSETLLALRSVLRFSSTDTWEPWFYCGLWNLSAGLCNCRQMWFRLVLGACRVMTEHIFAESSITVNLKRAAHLYIFRDFLRSATTSKEARGIPRVSICQ